MHAKYLGVILITRLTPGAHSMIIMVLTIQSVIDTVLPVLITTSIIWIMSTSLSDLLCIPVWNLTGIILVMRLTRGTAHGYYI